MVRRLRHVVGEMLEKWGLVEGAVSGNVFDLMTLVESDSYY